MMKFVAGTGPMAAHGKGPVNMVCSSRKEAAPARVPDARRKPR